jgi:hypothetical protein
MVTCCVHQSVESSFAIEQEKNKAVLPRSENSYVNRRTLLTLTSRNYLGTSTLPIPSFPPGRFMKSDGQFVCTSLRQNGHRTPSLLGYRMYFAVFAQYTNNLRKVSRGLRTPYEKVQLQKTYNIGTPMHKIKFFGGWARELDVVLDYIDPKVLPSPGAWQLLSWITPSGAPPNRPTSHATRQRWHK